MTYKNEVDPSQIQVFEWLIWIGNVVTLIPALIFFVSFKRQRNKNSGMYMIFVLSIGDLTFPIISMLAMISIFGMEVSKSLPIFSVGLYHFSLYWSTAMAIFCFKILSQKEFISDRRFIILSLVWCSVLSFLFSLM